MGPQALSYPLPFQFRPHAKFNGARTLVMATAGGAFAGTMLGLALLPLATPIYRAAAQIEFAQATGTAPLSDAARDARVDALVESSRSVPLVDRALDTIEGGDKAQLQSEASRQGQGRHALRLALLDHVRSERIGATNLIRVEARSNDPDRAATYANRMASALVAASLDDRLRDIGPGDVRTARDLARLRDRAERADPDFAAFRRASGATSAVDSGAEVDQLRSAVASASSDAAAAASRARAAAGHTIVQSAAIGQNGTSSLAQIRVQRAELASRAAALDCHYAGDYPQLATARRQIGAVDRAIKGEMTALSRSAGADAPAARARAAALGQGLAIAERRRTQAIGASAELARLERTATSALDGVHALETPLIQRDAERSIAQPEVRMTAPAVALLRPTSPDRLLVILFAALAGAGLAAAGTWSWRTNRPPVPVIVSL